LELIERSQSKQVLEKAVLRSLSKAIYSPDNEGHFGL
jgi:exoribonuclease R